MVKMLEEMHIECESAELQRIPNTTREIDPDSMRKVLKVISLLEEDDDVTNVFHDMEIPDDFEEEE
jgi:transcriptional/translational regulatory protein YebC/TACO1